MKYKKTNILKNSVLALACFSMGFVGATQITPALADSGINLEAAKGDPALARAIKNHMQKRFFKLINATDTQKKEIDSLFTNQLEYSIPLRQKMRQQGLQVADMMSDESVSDKELLSQIDKIHQIKDQVRHKRQRTLLKLRSILTQDQKDIVALRFKARLTGNPRLGLLLNQ